MPTADVAAEAAEEQIRLENILHSKCVMRDAVTTATRRKMCLQSKEKIEPPPYYVLVVPGRQIERSAA